MDLDYRSGAFGIDARLPPAEAPLEEQLRRNCEFFDEFLTLIPADKYVRDEEADAEGWKAKFWRNKAGNAPKQELKEKSKKARKDRYDLEKRKSIHDLAKEKAERKKRPRADGDDDDDGNGDDDGDGDGDTRMGGAAGKSPSGGDDDDDAGGDDRAESKQFTVGDTPMSGRARSITELRERLQARLASFRAAREGKGKKDDATAAASGGAATGGAAGAGAGAGGGKVARPRPESPDPTSRASAKRPRPSSPATPTTAPAHPAKAAAGAPATAPQAAAHPGKGGAAVGEQQAGGRNRRDLAPRVSAGQSTAGKPVASSDASEDTAGLSLAFGQVLSLPSGLAGTKLKSMADRARTTSSSSSLSAAAAPAGTSSSSSLSDPTSGSAAAVAALGVPGDADKKRVITGKGTAALTRMLRAAEAHRARLESLHGTTEGSELKKQTDWDTALRRAQGEKVRDDPALLRKALKRLERKKRKSKQVWDKRLESQKEERSARQDRREHNLGKRREQRQRKREAARTGVTAAPSAPAGAARPGFEGGSRATLN